MAVNFAKVIEAISTKNKKYSNLEQLVLNYGILTKKLNSAEQKSWYQAKGTEGTKNKISSTEAEFEKIRELFNTPLNDLLHEKNRLTGIKQKETSKKKLNMISQIAIASVTSQLEILNDVIALKSRLENLEKLDYYFGNEHKLLKLLGW